MYKAIKGIYEKDKLTLLEPAPTVEKSEVIVIFMTPEVATTIEKNVFPASPETYGRTKR